MASKGEQLPPDVYTAAMRQPRLSSRPARSGLVKRRKALCLAAALPWAALLAGCGQKGPLYHPPESEEEDEDDRTSAAPPAPGLRLGRTSAAPSAPGPRLG